MDFRTFNWGMIGILIGTIFVWYGIFAYGFFITLMWLIVIGAVLGLWLRLTGRA